MLTKYSIFFKKQFKQRLVKKTGSWYNYYYYSQWFFWGVQPYFFRGYVKYFSYLKLHFYRLLFKFIRKKFKKRKIFFFISCNANRIFSKKQKNSRMGKGVGKRYKWVFFLSPHHPVFIVYNCSYSRLKWVKQFLWTHTKLNIFWVPTYFSIY